MKYAYITNSKLRNIMLLANKKRLFTGNSIKISKTQSKIKKISQNSSEKRKKYQSKVPYFHANRDKAHGRYLDEIVLIR